MKKFDRNPKNVSRQKFCCDIYYSLSVVSISYNWYTQRTENLRRFWIFQVVMDCGQSRALRYNEWAMTKSKAKIRKRTGKLRKNFTFLVKINMILLLTERSWWRWVVVVWRNIFHTSLNLYIILRTCLFFKNCFIFQILLHIKQVALFCN